MCGGGSWGLKETGNRAKSAQGTAFPGGRGQCQVKVGGEKVSTPRGPAGRSGLENGKGTFTCAGLRVAVPGLAVGSLAPGVPRSRGRAPAPSGLDAPITWGRAGGPGGPLTPDTEPWEEETANNGEGRGRDGGWPGWAGRGGAVRWSAGSEQQPQPPPHPHLQGCPQHAFRPGPPCASSAGLPGGL